MRGLSGAAAEATYGGSGAKLKRIGAVVAVLGGGTQLKLRTAAVRGAVVAVLGGGALLKRRTEARGAVVAVLGRALRRLGR